MRRSALIDLISSDVPQKQERGILYTPSEIAGQVDLWEKTFRIFKQHSAEMGTFMHRFLKKAKGTVICTGAGTSEFIGYCISSLIRKNFVIPVNVFSTTSIVTVPEDVFLSKIPLLLISFARSGNSPESIGAVRIADMLNDEVFHIIITCNEDGKLRTWAEGKSHAYVLTLDSATNDRGLAMTASFSNMVIAAQMLSFVFSLDEYEKIFPNIVNAGRNMLEIAPNTAREICTLDFTRAVFLGDGNNYGTAIESHLKLQELTAGAVMCSYDTFPGLRHGPEAVIDARTLVVAFLSPDPYTRAYEEDLLLEIRNKKIGKALVTCGKNLSDPLRRVSDFVIDCDPGGMLKLGDRFTPPVFVIAGQLLGLFKSIDLGCKPDTPSESGVIHRVVEGVKVYDPKRFREKGKLKIIAER
jgi:tagatose-6-phosphate ketose/aldose isomerase